MTIYNLYIIRCSATGKSYIGSTTRSPIERLEDHLRPLSQSLVGEAALRFGRAAFSVEHLGCAIDRKAADDMEGMLVVQHRTARPFGYNKTLGGSRHMTSEQRGYFITQRYWPGRGWRREPVMVRLHHPTPTRPLAP